MRLKLQGAVVLKQAIVSCPGGHATSSTTRCADGAGSLSLSAIRYAAHVLTQITHDHMQSHPARLMILVAGPYRSGTGDDPAKLAANVAAMEAFAMPLFRAGHVPLVGEWLGLPLATLAGSVRIGDAALE